MVKLNNFGQQPSQPAFSQTDNNSNPQTSFNEPNPNQQPAQKGLISLPPALMQIIPWIPFALEAMTGQKIPQMGGTIAEIQASLAQIQFSLTQLLNQQQQLWTKLESLETNANSQLNSLSQQVASTNQAFRLRHQKETKSLEFNPRPTAELPSNAIEYE